MKWMLLLVVLVAACSGDSKTLAGPVTANVGGVWNINWSNLSTAGMSCIATGGHLTLSQSGTAFTGSYSNAVLTCNGTSSVPLSGIVVNGTVNGNSVAFDVDASDLHQSGTVSGNSMTGSAVWRIGINGQTFTLNGAWSAAR